MRQVQLCVLPSPLWEVELTLCVFADIYELVQPQRVPTGLTTSADRTLAQIRVVQLVSEGLCDTTGLYVLRSQATVL